MGTGGRGRFGESQASVGPSWCEGSGGRPSGGSRGAQGKGWGWRQKAGIMSAEQGNRL